MPTSIPSSPCEAQTNRKHSSFGHDKSLEIRPYAALPNRPVMFYAGDGVSDLSAAKETDLLFAKAGRGKFSLCIFIESLNN